MKKTTLALILIGVLFGFFSYSSVQAQTATDNRISLFFFFDLDNTCSFNPTSEFGQNLSAGAKACGAELLGEYIRDMITFLFRLAIALAVLMIMVGGFQWLLAIGNSGKISNAKDTIQQAVLGLILASVAALLFSQIDRSFIDLKSPDLRLKVIEGTNCIEYSTDYYTCALHDVCTWSCKDRSIDSASGEFQKCSGICLKKADICGPAIQQFLQPPAPGQFCELATHSELECVRNSSSSGDFNKNWEAICCAAGSQSTARYVLVPRNDSMDQSAECNRCYAGLWAVSDKYCEANNP